MRFRTIARAEWFRMEGGRRFKDGNGVGNERQDERSRAG